MSTACCALIAVKRRTDCKSRLAGNLDPAQRVDLARRMLDRVIAAAGVARCIDGVIVVSPERDTVAAHVPVVRDDGRDLNAAFELARRRAVAAGARSVLLLPADLPELTGSDLDAVVRGGRTAGVAIAPDRSGNGTNALFVAGAAGGFPLAFGSASRRRHEEAARRLGILPALITRPGLTHDIDTFADLAGHANRRNPPVAARAARPSTRPRACLR